MVKKGYPTPSDAWLAKENGRVPREILLAPNVKILEYADPVRIERFIQQHIAGRFNAGNHLYRLFSTELSLRECI